MNVSQLNNNEYASFYEGYIKMLNNIELLEALNSSFKDILKIADGISEEKSNYQYAKDKWTLKELFQHLIDTERIMCYRALRFSRNDKTQINGFDEDWYVKNADCNHRNFKTIVEELSLVRKSSILMFQSFTNEMLTRTGNANGDTISVRALGFIISGHLMHHTKIIKERYL
ncbi:DinB family protein [Lutibacter sp.]